MTPERYRQVVAVFDAACAVEGAAREALLQARCAGDAGLRAAVEGMLAQDARRTLLRTSATHGGPAGGGALALQALGAGGAQDAVPERLGEYRILGVLGAGAMGTVYRAEQQSPRREVALKTIHWWTLSPQAVERFRSEAQALAQLQHPGIPQVYEVAEDAAHLSFAMELVEGPSLAEHAATLGGDVRRVLALVADVADAVHHAHLRGLVHRDLKPDNIRVTAGGQPKVLDFGISLQLGAGGGAAAVREVSGTLAYMSPEQLFPEGGVDIRADVYALGVIAYELLCGERPFRLTGLDFEAARALVRDAPVVPLDRRRPGLPADVCSAVARALEKERERRYASAAELAEDLRRHLRHEPVRAHAGGARYRAGRWLRRNRALAAAAGVVFAALAAGGGASFALYRQAEGARGREAEQRVQAEAARDTARAEAAKSAASVEFLAELLRHADPNRTMGRELTVREALDGAAARLEAGSLAAQPLVEASVRLTLARAYRGIGQEATAAGQELAAGRLEAAGRLGTGEEAAAVLRALGTLHEERGEFARAEPALARCLALERALHAGGAHPHLVDTLQQQGQVLRESGRYAQGEAAFREALAQARALVAAGRASPLDVREALEPLAILLANLGRYDEALALLREALAIAEAQHGPEHTEVASTLHNTAWVLKEAERGSEAWPLLERALAIRTRVLGRRHLRVANQLTLHWAIAMDEGDLDRAERLAREAMELLVEVYGPEHPQVVQNRSGEVRLLLLRGRYAEAQRGAEALLASHRARYGEGHPLTASAGSLLAQALLGLGRHAEAVALLRTSVATLEARVGPQARNARKARAALERALATARAAAE